VTAERERFPLIVQIAFKTILFMDNFLTALKFQRRQRSLQVFAH